MAAGRGDLVRLALRLIVEEALESEVADALGRERYARGEGERAGYRNGYRTGKVKTAEGAVEYAAPQVRETPEPFVSGVRSALSGRAQALEDLAVELYARGLSTRDIEDAFTDERSRRLLSRAPVSEINERLWAEYEAFSKRDLSEHAIAYLYVDGIAERLRPGQKREAALAAWGIGADGRKVLVALMAGSKEHVETVRAFFQDLRTGPGRPLACRLRRRAGNHSGDRGRLSALGAPALPGPSHARSRRQGLGRSVAGVQGARRRLPPGAVASDRARAGERHPRRLRRGRAERARLL
jgi:putative transposase